MLLFLLLFVEFKALLFINYTFNYENGIIVMKLNVKLKSISCEKDNFLIEPFDFCLKL